MSCCSQHLRCIFYLKSQNPCHVFLLLNRILDLKEVAIVTWKILMPFDERQFNVTATTGDQVYAKGVHENTVAVLFVGLRTPVAS